MASRSNRKPLPEPFSHVEVDVLRLVSSGSRDELGYTVGIMNTEFGQGRRVGIEYAEAEARGVLRAIAAHKRRMREAPISETG